MSSATVGIGSLLADRYRIEAVLGIGGMSTVYRAKDESLGRTVAIKVFRELLSDAKALERQRAEVTLIASFEHPTLVTLFDAVSIGGGSDSEHAFLVMQYVDGDDLGAEFASGPLPEPRAIEIAHAIGDALAYVHEQGVIHRDVKPGNILVPRAPRLGAARALLADFGIARFLDGLALTATGSVLGTAQYLSPEQALGRELTPATDVYSLGLVLIEAVGGTRAFSGVGMEAVAARISSDPVVPPGASEGLAAIMRAMTQRDAGARPSALEVRDRLAELAVSGELPATAALPAQPDPTVAFGPGDAYAPTMVLPAADETTVADDIPVVDEIPVVSDAPTATTTQLPRAAAPASTARFVEIGTPRRRVAIAVIAAAVVAIIAILVAVTLPHSTPASETTSTHPPATATSSTPTPTAVPAVVTTPSVPPPSVPSVTTPPAAPTKTKPDKGPGNGNGKGHGKKP